MITVSEITEAVRQMRRVGSDTQRWEVKEAVNQLPKSLYKTLSSFANTSGGLIILGLSEKNGFRPAPGFDAGKACSQLSEAGDRLTPILRLEIEKIPFEDRLLVVAKVPDIPKNQRPCYITARGRYEGSFIRTGDGDRHLSPYEIDRLTEESRQPQYDLEPVERASISDLNPDVLEAIVTRSRELFPRVFGRLPNETILTQLGVLTRVEDKVCPTLAGLLAVGTFPQQYFPRLEVVFTVYEGTTKATDPRTGLKYLDSKEIIGSIPDMLTETLALVQDRMRTGAVVTEGLRKDIPDYPMPAVREAVANALQHRDYSPEGRGSQVQVNLYADRLEITNPGGLYGSTTVESLGKDGISSTRNEFLSRLLTYTPFQDGFVVENKGTGFITIQSALEKALMPPPKVRNSLTFFSLTLEKRRRTPAETSADFWKNLDEAILKEIGHKGSMSVKELIEASGTPRPTMSAHLRKLVKNGQIEPLEINKSPKQRYRLVRKSSADKLDQ